MLPRADVDALCILVMVWLDPRCVGDANLDRADLYRTNYEATKLAIGRAMREVRERDGPALHAADVNFEVSFLFGGQIYGERMRLFMIYPAGNFIE